MEKLLRLETIDSPIGEVLIALDGGRPSAVDFADYRARMERLLRRHYVHNDQYRDVCLEPGRPTSAASRLLGEYFAGSIDALEQIAIVVSGTPFQRSVWGQLRRIPPGRTVSYAQLARAIGRPTAIRAVGHANGSNPLVLVSPCHRVVASDGGLGGYGGGLARKRWLLAHERGLAEDRSRSTIVSSTEAWTARVNP